MKLIQYLIFSRNKPELIEELSIVYGKNPKLLQVADLLIEFQPETFVIILDNKELSENWFPSQIGEWPSDWIASDQIYMEGVPPGVIML